MERDAPALVLPDAENGDRATAPVACGGRSTRPTAPADANRATALEHASDLLTELLDPYAGRLDGCEWHAVSAARQVICRLARELRRDGI